MRYILPLLSLNACIPKVADTAIEGDADTDADADTDSGIEAYTVVLTTTDYTVGALATIGGTTGTLTDGIVTLGGDAVVNTDATHSYILERGGENTVRAYVTGAWDAPIFEVSTGDGSNPAAATPCGAYLWVSLYNGGALSAFNLETQALAGSVDLVDFDDGDGSGNPTSLYCAPNGSLYAALERYSYVDYTSVAGAIVKVDPVAFSILDSWETVNNANFLPHAADATTLWIDGGNYGALDGALVAFDTTTDTLGAPIWEESDLGMNVSQISTGNAETAIMVTNDGLTWEVWCLHLTDWTYERVEQPGAFIGGGAVSPDGKVWLTYAYGFNPDLPVTVLGTVAWDSATCARAEPVHTDLPPYSLGVSG